MRQRVPRMVALGMVVIVLLIAPGASPQSGPPVHVTPTVTAQAVHGLSIGPGRKLWALVFPARGGGKPGGAVCTDDVNTQTEYTPLGSLLPGTVSFNINDASIPIDKTLAVDAIHASFETWELAAGKSLFNVVTGGDATVPAEDGKNTVGWVKIIPRNVLAATWIWTQAGLDGNDYVTDVDIFYNSFHSWGVFADCTPTETRFEVANIGVHEIGHVVGLDHFSDTAAMATMYPSASKGEVKKQTLTPGDINGVQDVTAHLQ